jgi:predicted nucleic acid-binding protein
MSFLLDTDTCSAYLKGHRAVGNRFLQHTGGLHVSAITMDELYTWALRAAAPPGRLQNVQELLNDLTLLDVTHDVARQFGELRAARFDRGLPPPEMDLLIAATALVHDLTLVTHNSKDYVNVPGLRMSDWLVP